MKIQINHYIPEEGITQQDLFEDVERVLVATSNRSDKDTMLQLDFKYGSENYKKFNFHCCGIYLEENDTVQIVEY